MRVKEIQVKGLFNMFDHTIPLNMEEHLTIIYGVNGIGKTMLFKIIQAFFKEEFGELAALPFTNLNIIFEDNSSINFANTREGYTIFYNENLFIFEKEDKEKYNLIKITSKLPISKEEDPLHEERLIENLQNTILSRLLNTVFIQTQRLLHFKNNGSPNSTTAAVNTYAKDLSNLIAEKYTCLL